MRAHARPRSDTPTGAAGYGARPAILVGSQSVVIPAPASRSTAHEPSAIASRPTDTLFQPTWQSPRDVARGAVVVIQEIFGVTGHIERVAEQYAAQGYLAIAPALFDRQQRGVNLPYDAGGAAKGFALTQKADRAGLRGGPRRRRSTRSPMRARSAWSATAGAAPSPTWPAAARTSPRPSCTTAAASRNMLDDTPRCPMLFHFGEQDAHIPLADVARIRAAFPQGEYHHVRGRARLQLPRPRRASMPRRRTSRSGARSNSSANTWAERQIMTLTLKDGALLRQQCYVDGAWIDAASGEKVEVTNPATRRGARHRAEPWTATKPAQPSPPRRRRSRRGRRAPPRIAPRLLRRWHDLMMAATRTISRR